MRFTEKGNLHKNFPLPSKNIPTTGVGEGVILRFNTFYLKIYDDDKSEAYIVQGFRYREQHPVFEYLVKMFEFRQFASQFTRENYLLEFQQPCEDPNCIIWSLNGTWDEGNFY